MSERVFRTDGLQPESTSRLIKHLQVDLQRLKAAQSLDAGPERRRLLKAYYFPIASRPYEYVFVFINWAIALGYGWVLWGDFVMQSQPWWAIAVTLPLAGFIADLMSAGYHKWLDSYVSELHPRWGTAARAFRVHHEFPRNLNEATYWHNVSAFAPFMTFLYAIVFAARWITPMHPLMGLTTWTLIALFSNGTEIHKRSHMKNPGRLILGLQRARLLLAPSVHVQHHSGGVDSDYGIINGWSNGLLRRLNLWNKLDLFVFKTWGRWPHNWIQVPKNTPESVIELVRRGEIQIPPQLALYMAYFPRAENPFAEFIESSAEDLEGRSESPPYAS